MRLLFRCGWTGRQRARLAVSRLRPYHVCVCCWWQRARLVVSRLRPYHV